MSGLLYDDKSYNAFEEFKACVQQGLTQTEKSIASQFLYDARGSALFNDITRLEEYYLTKTEIDILSTYQNFILQDIGDAPFNLIDLGPGEGIKTQILIEAFMNHASQFSYIPIDISVQYLKHLEEEFQQKFPALEVKGIHADFYKGLEWLAQNNSDERNVLLFLGSSIGNFNPQTTQQFLKSLHKNLKTGDLLILGFDLCKSIDLLMHAYNDNKGLTKAFNLNILQRLNRELHAHFDLKKFSHFPIYNVYSHAMESYLISKEEQTIAIDFLHQSIHFDAMEPILIEYSYKYQLSQIQKLARDNGFRVVNNYFDTNEYFLDSVWERV